MEPTQLILMGNPIVKFLGILQTSCQEQTLLKIKYRNLQLIVLETKTTYTQNVSLLIVLHATMTRA